ncbi:MAG: glycosyltransferase [Chitinophagales bacterium]|nr:glycosyltransferase [Chitinophagales bacterium]
MMILIYGYIAVIIIQLLFYIFFLFKFNQKNQIKNNDLPITIVVCCKNEAQNLKRLIPIIMQQDYPNFELLLVDDGSTDSTVDVIIHYKKEYKNINYLFVDEKDKIGVGKKFALQQGVQKAQHDIIVVTDADCYPISKEWLQKMVQAKQDKAIVLGISLPFCINGNTVEKLQDYETSITALQYISLANINCAYMGVGRNMLFEKQVFLDKNWTDKEMNMLSGDDDLFIQTQAKKNNVTTCTDTNAYTYFDAKSTWNAWFKQKQRHLSTGFTYQIKHKVILSLFLLTKLLVYMLSIMISIYNFKYLVLLLLYSELILLTSRYLYKKNNLFQFFKFSFVFDIIYCFSIIFIGLVAYFKPSKSWK